MALTSEERSEKARAAWAVRKARAAQEAAASGEADAGFDPAGAVAGEKLRAEPTGDGEVRIVHFVADGFTAMSQVWYRGQEVSLTVGSPEYLLETDKTGATWLDLDEDAQIARYGKVMFRPGPWKGKTELMTEEQYLSALSTSDAEAVKKFEKQRQRLAGSPGAPVVAR